LKAENVMRRRNAARENACVKRKRRVWKEASGVPKKAAQPGTLWQCLPGAGSSVAVGPTVVPAAVITEMLVVRRMKEAGITDYDR